MNTLKSLSPNSTFTQLYSWWWLRPRPSSTPNPTSKLHCAKCQMCTGATDVAGHRHRLKDTGQQCLSAAALSCHCHPHHHQSSSSSSSLFSSPSLPSSSVIVSNHMCNMCQQRQPRSAQSRSTCRAGKSRRRFSTQKVLVSFLLFLLLLVSAAHGNYLTPPFCWLLFLRWLFVLKDTSEQVQSICFLAPFSTFIFITSSTYLSICFVERKREATNKDIVLFCFPHFVPMAYCLLTIYLLCLPWQ